VHRFDYYGVREKQQRLDFNRQPISVRHLEFATATVPKGRRNVGKRAWLASYAHLNDTWVYIE